MGNELSMVTYESLSGIMVKLDADTVRNQIARGNGKITDQEVAFFLRTCQAKKLDPLENGEVYLVKYDDKAPAQTVVGYHAYLRRAERFPEYRGYKAGVVVMRNDNVVYKEGAAVYRQIGEELIGGWCRVFREMPNGRIDETYAEVSLDEYSTGKSNWAAKPGTMIRKVAISQAVRGAFPNEYEGLYTADEMIASGAVPANVIEVDGEAVPNGTAKESAVETKITDAEHEGFCKAISDAMPDASKELKFNVYRIILNTIGVTKKEDITQTQLERAMSMIKDVAATVLMEAQKTENAE